MRPVIQMVFASSALTANAGNDASICSGNSTTLTASASGGTSPYNYLWSTGANTASISVSPASTTTFTVTVTDGNSATASDAVIVNVNSTVVPGVSIVANPSGMIEAGTSVTFTATPTNGGTPTYQWQKGGEDISGATSSTYAYTPSDGDIITCAMTSNAPCANPLTVTSDQITITIGMDCNYFAGKAGNTSLTSNNNLGIGCQALISLVSGENNVGLGYKSLYSTANGSENVGIGYEALYSNLGGNWGRHNIGIGSQALYNSNGTGNVGIGGMALYSSTGVVNGNTALGFNAGYKITTGSNNTFLGNGAGNNNNQKVDATNSMALGNGAYTTADNQYVYGNTSVAYHIFPTGNVAIGGTNPVAKLDIYNNNIYGTDAAIIVRNGDTDADVQFLVKGSGYVVARDILVKTGDIFPDYVFEKNYNLKTLSEVEKYINENKHLPDVPSAKEINNNGLNLVDMDAILLKKIEEQTLYIIDLQKQLIDMQKQIDDLKK